MDAEGAPFFVNSSLAPVCLFRRRLKSVADVLRSIKRHGYTQKGYWSAVGRHGPCGPGGFFQTRIGSESGFLIRSMFSMTSLGKVVVWRRDAGLRKWASWLRPWLRPDFVLPSPFLVMKDPQIQSSQDID